MPGVAALFTALLVASVAPPCRAESESRRALDAIIAAALPLVHQPTPGGPATALDPVNTALEDGGRRLWARAVDVPLVMPAGDRLTVSLRTRHAAGRLVAWPADAPHITLDRADDRWLLTVGDDRLRWTGTPSTADGWRSIAITLDGARGHIGLWIDGRQRARRVRAPFGVPGGRWLRIGPAAGDVADLAVWPDLPGADSLLEQHLAATGLRPAPEPDRIALTVNRSPGPARFGCPRFAPDGRWLAGCHSNALVFVDRATGEATGTHIEHLEPLTAVSIDPTGRYVATADGTSTALIWQAATQRPITRLDVGHPVAGVAFAPDGRTLALWTPAEAPGALTRIPFYDPLAAPRTIALPAPVRHLIWRPDGDELALVLDGAPPRRLGPDGSRAAGAAPAQVVAWHPTDPVLFAGSVDGRIWRHGPDGVRQVRATAGSDRVPAPGRLPALFAPDRPAGARWVIGSRWGSFGRPPWSPPRDVRAVAALAVDARRIAVANDAGVTLLDHDGRRVATLPQPTPATAVALFDSTLLTGGADGVMRRYGHDGRPLGEAAAPPPDSEGNPQPIRALRIAPDGARVVVDHLGAWHARILPLDGSAAPAARRPGPPPTARMAVSPAGLRLLVAGYTGALTGWDLTRLRRVTGFSAPSPTTSLAWTADGPVTGHVDGTIRRWRIDGRLIEAHPAHAASPQFTVGGQSMPSGGVDGLFALRDGSWVSSGRMAVRHWQGSTSTRRALPTPSLQITRPVIDGLGWLVISTVTGPIRLDPATGAHQALPPPADITGSPYAFLAADGPFVAAVRHGADGQRLTVWNIAGDAPALVLDRPLPLFARSLALDDAGERLALVGSVRAADGSWQFPILLLDPRTGDIRARVEGHRAAPSAVRFETAADGTPRLHTGSWDGHQRVFALDGADTRLIERRSGCPAMALHTGPSHVALCSDRIELRRDGGRLTLIDDADGQWLIASDDGLFAASREGDGLAAAISGPRRIGLDRLALTRNRPDLIAARFGLGDAPLRADLAARVRRRRARHGLSTAPPTPAALPQVDLEPVRVDGSTLEVTAGARSAVNLTRWRVRIDGTPVAEGPLSGTVARFTARARLTDGPNRVEVDVADTEGRWSPRAVAVVEHHDPRPPRLFAVAFGVSRYADPAIRDLRFAHRDALDLVDRFATNKGPWADVLTRAFTDEAVTDDAFADAERLLATADPRDTVIVFVSGHGLYDRGGVYRYLTHDARLADVEAALPFERIEALLDATPARQRLLLLDTCQSGELFEGEAISAPSPSHGGEMRARVIDPSATARLIRPIAAAPARADDRRDRFVDRDLRRGRGAVVFSSSRGAEASWELEALANGAFTEALLDGLAGSADRDGDGRIALLELEAHVAAQVARLTGDRQHPNISRENRAARLSLPILPAN